MTKTPKKPDAKEAVFVAEYLVDLDPKRAAIVAGYSESMAASKAYQWVSNGKVKPHVFAAIEAAMAKRSAKTEITADRVLQELWAIATADPNELIQWRRGACPKCWDEDGLDVEDELEAQAHGGALRRSRKPEDLPARICEPNPDCETCGGEGTGRPYAADTRTLSETGKRLYAGVKVTKDGFEIKMHDKAAALVNVGRHLGMFTDKSEVKHVLPDEVAEWLGQRS